MKKLVSSMTLIVLAFAMFIEPLAPPSKANTNSPASARAEVSVPVASAPAWQSVPVAARAPALAYPLAKVRNRTIFPATGTVRYVSHLCKDDWFYVPAGILQRDGTIKEGFWQARKRGSCLIKRVEAQLRGAGRGVTSYTSSGTSYSNFIIQGTQTDFRVWSDHGKCEKPGRQEPRILYYQQNQMADLNRLESGRLFVLSNDSAR